MSHRIHTLIALLLVPLSTLQAAEPATKPNIVILLADQWRATATGYAGEQRQTAHVVAEALDKPRQLAIAGVLLTILCCTSRGIRLQGKAAGEAD